MTAPRDLAIADPDVSISTNALTKAMPAISTRSAPTPWALTTAIVRAVIRAMVSSVTISTNAKPIPAVPTRVAGTWRVRIAVSAIPGTRAMVIIATISTSALTKPTAVTLTRSAPILPVATLANAFQVTKATGSVVTT